MTESIRELRRICQSGRNTELYRMNWFDRNVTRRISIYITKVFLEIGLSANQTTAISFVAAVAGGVFLALGNGVFSIAGILLFYVYFVLDCVDGEIARYNKSESPLGLYWDLIAGWIAWPLVLACFSIGIYNATDTPLALGFGTLAVAGWLVYITMRHLPYYVLHEKGLLREALEEPIAKEPRTMGLGQAVFGTRGFIPVILLVSAIDCFINPFYLSHFAFNARFIYLILFGTATLAGILITMHNTYREGVRIHKA